MTTTTPSIPFDSGAKPSLPMDVRNKTLLAIMGIVPLAAILAIIDKPLLGGIVIGNMISSPHEIAYWTAILTVPHIVASLVTFADREYVTHHKKNLLRAIGLAALLAFAAPFIIGIGHSALTGIPANSYMEYASQGTMGTLVIMAFYTMYHNLMQQYGISLMMLRQPPTFSYQMWRWFTIIPAGLAYTALMFTHALKSDAIWDISILLIGICLIVATLFGLRFLVTVFKNPNRTRTGVIYLLANMALLYVCFGLMLGGYGFMAMLVPRLTHDLTAFWIYMVHDQNRNSDKIRNIFYWPKKIGIQPIFLCVPIALAISLVLLTLSKSLFMVTAFVTSLNYIHYYMEGYMWKRGEPHRLHVPFVDR